jgi:RNA polymerase sigma-70 factor (ECF subfamily)
MITERTEPSDAELVARARAGDTGAFGALVERHQAAALRVAAAVSGSTSDAADIAQEAFVKAYRSLSKLAEPATVRGWLLRIVANEAKNHLRGRHRRLTREERFGSWVVSPTPDPELSALDAEAAHGLAAALGRIPVRHRQVLAYRYFAGLSERDTAAAMGVAAGTVKSRTSRALARLRAELEG